MRKAFAVKIRVVLLLLTAFWLAACGGQPLDATTQTLEQVSGKLSPEKAMSLLAVVSPGNTMWSVVYGLQTGDIQLALGRKYDAIHKFHLDMQE